ncbi:MAG: flavodoxin family protein [Pseudoramibacter sp.]
MNITVIHGQSHRGSTWHIAEALAKQVGGTVTSFMLPRDFSAFCVGCSQCFMKDEGRCPHAAQLAPITEALDRADLIILASPVYVYHATGAMKALLDHYAYRWMLHRPAAGMFFKQAAVISTAAGGGTRSTNKDMADSLSFWGVSHIEKLGFNVRAVNWESVPPDRKAEISKQVGRTARRIQRRAGQVKPSIKTKAMFNIMRRISRGGLTEADKAYWKKQGWAGSGRPWKKA